MSSGVLKVKDTGVPWLGAVPAHWRRMRLRDAVESCLNGVWGDEPRGDENDTPIIRVADFDRGSRRTFAHQTVRNVAEEQRKTRELTSGDLLIEKSGGGEQQSVGMVVEYTGPDGAVCSNFVARMRPRDGVRPRYLTYVHAHLYSRGVPTLSIKQSTGIQNLDSTAYLGEALYLPPGDEQDAIASYLNVETARIDELVADKESLVETLKELRRSTVAEAITKGVGDARLMRPSELSWVNEMPSDWRTLSLKRLVRLSGGHTPATGNPAYWDGSVPWFSPKDMKSDELHDSIDHVTELAVAESGLQVIEAGTTMIVVRGMILAHTFPVCVSQVEATINQDMKALVPDEGVDARYLPWLLRGASALFLSLTEQSAHGTMALRTDRFMSEKLPIPPLREQIKIVEHLEAERKRIDGLLAQIRQEIGLLKELRSTTITDAVLGRIHVSDHAKNLRTRRAL